MTAHVQRAIERTSSIILGKDRQIRLAMVCLLTRGHLLIEDLPGVGKTTLAQALAGTLGLSFQRIQFTSDLLPADITGTSVYDRHTGRFTFHHGPVFAQLVLADEVNRATPKTQSALLEAMEERQVTADGETRPLPEPFFVIATQNPIDQVGTFPLPDSQLDRFTMRIALGYPDSRAERALLEGRDRRAMLDELAPALELDELLDTQAAVERIHVSEALLDYVQALVRHTREDPQYATGLSPRGGLALLRAAQAWALVDGRDAVLPEDVQAVLEPVCGHRLQRREIPDSGQAAATEELLESVAIP